MTPKLMVLLKNHLKTRHNLVFYDYQNKVAEQILNALLQNMQLTAGATEADIKKLTNIEIPIEFARQSGKTTTVVHIIEFIMIFFPRLFNKPIAIGIFAPQREQAKTDFDRLKAALRRDLELIPASEMSEEVAKEESNAKTIVLPNGASCYIFPVTSTSKPESKTLDLMVFEESQDLADRIVQGQIWPMGANTNSPRIYIGTAGVQINYFYRLIQAAKALVLDWEMIAAQKRELYRLTEDAQHLIYENTVLAEKERLGEEHDDFRRPYKLEWIIGSGQFVTMEQLDKLVAERKRTYREKESDCFVGIDVAKNPDSTVVTVIRATKDGKKELLNWLELRGDNYQNQFEIILDWIGNYQVRAIAIDSTGQGDFMPDLFENNSQWRDEDSGLYRVKFSQSSKDVMYKNLKASIVELLTSLPELRTKEAERFRLQLLDLQQEYKGQFLSVHHPDAPDAHDDYPDSWALAEWAYAKYNEDRVDIVVMEAKREDNGYFEEVGWH